MKIKKLISLLLAAMLTVTSNGNCFAVGPDEGCDSDDSLSDIVIPDRVPIDDRLEERVRLNKQRAQQLLEQLDRSDARIVELRAIHTRNQGELDRINKNLCDTIRERDDLKLQLDAAERDLQRYRNGTNPSRTCSIFKDKRFYKGTATGGALAAAIATIGIGVYARITNAHSHNK